MKFLTLLMVGLMVIMFMTSINGIMAQDEGSEGETLPDGAKTEYDEIDIGALLDQNNTDGNEAGGDGYYPKQCGADTEFFKFYWIKNKKITLPLINIPKPIEVTVTDLGCPCEQFEIIINGKSIGFTSDPKKDADCYYPIKDPVQALNDFRFSARKFILPPGPNVVQIRAKKACAYFGKFAIGARFDDGTCCRGDTFTVARPPVPGKKANDVCEYLGLDLGEIDAWNIKEATNVAFTCLGKQSESWVKSWNGDPYKGTCVALFAGHSSRHGTIIRPKGGCYDKNPTLCQEPPKYPWN